jgi:hypothetical protein
MSTSEDFEELDMEGFPLKPMVKLFQKSRHHKVFSETISTNSCTFEIERPSYQPTLSKLFTEIDEMTGSLRKLRKKTSDLPERLLCLKQISENKIKFMKMEKEIKELEGCTFKPKTNVKVIKSSLKSFDKKQKEYVKSKNSTILKLSLQGLSSDANRKNTPILSSTCKNKDSKVHERLYNQSKVFSRCNNRK